MADKRMKDFDVGSVDQNQFIVGYDPAPLNNGERRYPVTSLTAYMQAVLQFASNSNPTIAGTVHADNYQIGQGTTATAGTFGFNNTNGPSIGLYGTAASGAGAMVFRSANIEKMRLSNIGNLLINTATDDGSNKLQVAGNATVTALASTGVDAGGANVRLLGIGNTKDVILRNDGSTFFLMTTDKSGQSQSWNGFRPLQVDMNTGAVRLDTLGTSGTGIGGALTVAGATTINNSLSVAGALSVSGVTSSGAVTGTASQGAVVASNGGGAGQTSMLLRREGGSTDQKTWELLQNGSGSLVVRTADDSYGNFTNLMLATRAATGVGIKNLAIMPSGGGVTVGNTADDGVNALQVNGSVRAANYVINGQAATDSGLVGINSTDNGPNIGFYGKSTTAAGALTFNSGGTERMRLTSAGNLLIGTSAPATGTGTVTIGNTISVYNAAQDTVALISTGSYNGGLSIEAFNGANTAKKNILLAGSGGRVLVGNGSTDDGATTLQIAGSGSFTSDLTVNKSGGGIRINDPAGTANSNLSFYKGGAVAWGIRGAWSSSDQLQFNSYDSGGVASTAMTIDRTTGLVTAQKGLTVAGGLTSTGTLTLPTANSGIDIGSITATGTSFVDFHSSGSGNDYDARVITTGGTAGTVGKGDLQYIAGSHSFVVGGVNELVVNTAGNVLVGGATDNGTQLNVNGSANISGTLTVGTLNAAAMNVPETISATGTGAVGLLMTNTMPSGGSRFKVYVGGGGYFNIVSMQSDGATINKVIMSADPAAAQVSIQSNTLQVGQSGVAYSGVVIGNNGYSPRIQTNSADSSIGFVNGANTTYNLQVFDTGDVYVNRGRLVVGSTAYQSDGNINGGIWGGPLSTWLANNKVNKYGDTMTGRLSFGNSGWQADMGLHNNRSGQDAWVYLRARDYGGLEIINSAYNAVVWSCDNAGQTWQSQLNVGNARLQTDGNLISGAMPYAGDLFGALQAVRNACATAGAQCPHGADGNEFGSINVGYANQTSDAGSPWVLTGIRSQNGSNVTYLRAGWLRNQ